MGQGTNGASPLKIAVVGAGIVGISSAEWLRRDGHEVTLFDRVRPGQGTSQGSGGILARAAVVPVPTPGLLAKVPGMLLDSNQPLFLRWSYLPRLLPWLIPYLRNSSAARVAQITQALSPLLSDAVEQHQALAEGTPAARHIVTSDYVYLYRDRAAFEADGFGWNLRASHGMTGRKMSAEDLAALDPNISNRYSFGYCLPHHGYISDPAAYLTDLAQWFTGQGGTFIEAAVSDIKPDQSGGGSLVAGGTTYTADRIVLATGAWSSSFARRLGHRAMLESERGYHIEFWGASHVPPVPYMLADGKFVVTPMAGRVRAAGTVEFGGLDAPRSRKPFNLLETGMRRLYPGFTCQERREWMGHRPATADSLPLLGPSPRQPSLYFAFGHQHVGLTAGPKSGRLIADMIAGRRPNFPMEPYSVNRFD